MHSISLEYTDLSQAALVKIFQLADLLGITPKDAAKVYLATQAKKASNNLERIASELGALAATQVNFTPDQAAS